MSARRPEGSPAQRALAKAHDAVSPPIAQHANRVLVRIDHEGIPWAIADGMLCCALASVLRPNRNHVVRGEDATKLAACVHALLSEFERTRAGGACSRSADGRLLVDAKAFGHMLMGGLQQPIEALVRPAYGGDVARSFQDRIYAISRTPLRRVLDALLHSLERRTAASVSDVRRSSLGLRTTVRARRDDGIDRFVRERCVRGRESCSVGALYRAYAAWTPTAKVGEPVSREDFCLLIDADHAIDVGEYQHIIVNVALATTPAVASAAAAATQPVQRRLSVAHDRQPAKSLPSSPASERDPLDGSPRCDKERGTGRASLGVLSSLRLLSPGKREPTSPMPDVRGQPRAQPPRDRPGGAPPRSPSPGRVPLSSDAPVRAKHETSSTQCRVRRDARSGAVSAIDLLYEATDSWDSLGGKSLTTRIIYALRVQGWNFDKRNLGVGRSTPTVRAADIDRFLGCATEVISARPEAWRIDAYRSSSSYASMLKTLGVEVDADSARVPPPPQPPPPPTGGGPPVRVKVEPFGSSGRCAPESPIISDGDDDDDDDSEGGVDDDADYSDSQDDSGIVQGETMPPHTVGHKDADCDPQEIDYPQQRQRPRNAPSTPTTHRKRRIVSESEDEGDDDDGGDDDDDGASDKRGKKSTAGAQRWSATQRPVDPPPPDRQARSSAGDKGRAFKKRRAGPDDIGQARPTAPTDAPTKPSDDHKVEPVEETQPLDEDQHNGALVDRVAARASGDKPLCVWRRSDGVWRLILAVRPGSDPHKAWRVVAAPNGGPLGATNGADRVCAEVHWMDWAHVRSKAVSLLTLSPHTVLSVDADCEPPAPGDPNAVATADTWIFDACRRWLRTPAADAAVGTQLVQRMIQSGAIRDDAPCYTECLRLADAIRRRCQQ